jgi:hypothetical protein
VLAEQNTSWRLWQQAWVSQLRKLASGYLFVFITASFEEEFKTRKYIDGEQDKRTGAFKSGDEWCQEQGFNRGFGFSDVDWGFAAETKAVNILDYERLHLEAVSKKNTLGTVFVTFDSLGYGKQIARPPWYSYQGDEAPPGVFSLI